MFLVWVLRKPIYGSSEGGEEANMELRQELSYYPLNHVSGNASPLFVLSPATLAASGRMVSYAGTGSPQKETLH